MAAPTPSVRVIPTAIRLDDGYQSVIAWASDTNLEVFEKTLQPPSYEGGGAHETSTMLNNAFETKAPQRLKGHGDGVVVAAYDPGELANVHALINLPDAITWAYPDGSAYVHWGFLQKAEFSPLTKGEQPEVTLTIVQTNWDPYNCVEAGPVWVDGTGSCGPAAIPAT